MRLHRFYINREEIELKHDFWLHDVALLHQWNNVLRYRTDQEVVLFDGVSEDRLYKITELSKTEAHLSLITEMKRQLPKKNVYLFWSLLKKDKNEWVLQKCTELGVSHFVPILADRSEKTGFNLERAQKIIVEASEQCGRSDIPSVREPLNIGTIFEEFKGSVQLLVAEQGESEDLEIQPDVGLLIGPEGGWSNEELNVFSEHGVQKIALHDFTLRAETAAVTAAGKLLQ